MYISFTEFIVYFVYAPGIIFTKERERYIIQARVYLIIYKEKRCQAYNPSCRRTTKLLFDHHLDNDLDALMRDTLQRDLCL